MKNSNSIPGYEMKNLILQNKEFLSALDHGASSNELEEIKNRGHWNNEHELPRMNMDIHPHQSDDEAA